jgi:hypothetical protein
MPIQRLPHATLLLLLSACGGGNDNPLPPGAKMEIFPSEITWEIGPGARPCVVDPAFYQDQLISFALKNASDQPLGGVDITTVLDLSEGTFSGTPVLGLYADSNGNGVADDAERVSIDGRGSYKTRTSKYDGSAQLWLRVNLSCPYRGHLNAYAGGAGAGVSINVTELAEN